MIDLKNIICVLFFVCFQTITLFGQEVSIVCSADAHVRDGSSYENVNYGSEPELNVKLASVGFTREIYLKFNLATLSGKTINSAKLVLTPSDAGSNADLTEIEVKYVSNDAWTETEITYSNKPTQGSVLDSKIGSEDTMEWNVSAQVISEASGDGVLSLALTSTVAGSNHKVDYNSKESSNVNFHPTLIVSTGVVTPIEKDVFLVIGQSNTAGRGEIETKDESVLNNVHLFNGVNTWELAENPLNKYSTIRKDLNVQGLGYAYTFGKVLQNIVSKDIGLVVNARGGTNINDWQKGASENYYGEALSRIKAALNVQGSELKGILWHQGESNRNDGAAYITKLETMLEDFRTDLGMPNLPLLAGELSYEREDNAGFNAIIATLPNKVNNTDYVSAEFLHTTDLTHFDSEAQRILGSRYAAKMLELVYGATIENQKVWVSEDAYVSGGINADKNYNAEAVLKVKSDADESLTNESYLKFDLSGISNKIIDAILVVNGSELDNNSLTPVFYETSDNWDETTITWNNKVSIGDDLESVSVSGSSLLDYKVFLSEYAQETQHSDNVLSIAIKDNSLTSGQFTFISKEDAVNQSVRPYLLVTTIKGITLGTEDIIENNLKNSVIMYPNPVKEQVYFKNLVNIKKLQIVDLRGKTILDDIDVTTAKNFGIKTSTFKKGIYLVRFFSTDGSLTTKKLIIY